MIPGQRIRFMGRNCRVSGYPFLICMDEIGHGRACSEMERFIPFTRDKFNEYFGIAGRIRCGAFPDFETMDALRIFVDTVESVYQGHTTWETNIGARRDKIERIRLGMHTGNPGVK